VSTQESAPSSVNSAMEHLLIERPGQTTGEFTQAKSLTSKNGVISVCYIIFKL
jgi:hypothetical protein